MSEQLSSVTPRLEVAAEGRNGSGVQAKPTTTRWYQKRVGPTAILALVALVALATWLVLESRPSGTTTDNAPVALSADGLATLAAAVPQPIYWVGPRATGSYELTRTLDRVYVRYLPDGAAAGDPRPFLTIGTYTMANAYDVMKRTFATPGNEVLETPKGGIAVIDATRPTSVYVAYPDTDFQVEVYSPSASEARELAITDQVLSVTASAANSTGPVATTPAALKTLSTSLGHPIYWAGEKENVTYELTQTTDGKTFVRYLPAGVEPGDKAPYLTIATYPVDDAYAATKASADGTPSVTLELAKGAIAVYARGGGSNVHLATKGSNVQVEVYDPSPAVPPSLVQAGTIVPVG